MKGQWIRAQTTRSERISCKGQVLIHHLKQVPAAAGFFSLDSSSSLLAARRFGAGTFRSVLSLCAAGLTPDSRTSSLCVCARVLRTYEPTVSLKGENKTNPVGRMDRGGHGRRKWEHGA